MSKNFEKSIQITVPKLKEIQDNYTRAVRSNYGETDKNVRPRIDKNRIDNNIKEKISVADNEAERIKILGGSDEV